MGLGVALFQGFGTFSFQVRDPQQFVTQIVGAQGMVRTDDIEARMRSMLLSKLQDLLGETAAKYSVPELIGLTEELGAGVRAKGQDDFSAIGLLLKSFYIENLKPSSKSAEELAPWVCWICRLIRNSGRLPARCRSKSIGQG
jgi:membrane protease subunit (stomatin/prohibitin family)